MYNDDNDPVIRRSDVRTYLWRRAGISLTLALVCFASLLIVMGHTANTQGKSQNATFTAEAQQDGTTAAQISGYSSGAQAVVQSYYVSISAQDYAAAYTNLTANATYNGKSISQAAFIQQAKARDKKDGIVTHFTVSSDGADPDAVEVQVTRQHGQSYSVSLECAPDNIGDLDGTWHIMSFDEI